MYDRFANDYNAMTTADIFDAIMSNNDLKIKDGEAFYNSYEGLTGPAAIVSAVNSFRLWKGVYPLYLREADIPKGISPEGIKEEQFSRKVEEVRGNLLYVALYNAQIKEYNKNNQDKKEYMVYKLDGKNDEANLEIRRRNNGGQSEIVSDEKIDSEKDKLTVSYMRDQVQAMRREHKLQKELEQQQQVEQTVKPEVKKEGATSKIYQALGSVKALAKKVSQNKTLSNAKNSIKKAAKSAQKTVESKAEVVGKKAGKLKESAETIVEETKNRFRR
jgi:hypothetical protein